MSRLSGASCTRAFRSGTDGRAFVKGVAGGATGTDPELRFGIFYASPTASAIGSLPALGRAEARPASRHARGCDEEIAAPAAVVDVVGPLPTSEMPVSGAIRHGGRYRNADPPTRQATTPLAVIPGSGARVSPASASEASEATKWP
jgi:hypothetical protein